MSINLNMFLVNQQHDQYAEKIGENDNLPYLLLFCLDLYGQYHRSS